LFEVAIALDTQTRADASKGLSGVAS
jgi:hypothetical protein